MNILIKAIYICFLVSLLCFAICAQNSAITPEMRSQANDFYQKKDWPNALKAYENIVKAEEKNVNARYRYGVSLLELNNVTEAQKQLEQVFTASPNPFFAFSLARAFVKLNDKEKAYQTLEKSLTVGGIQPQALTDEKDFAALKEEPRFKDLVKKSDITVNPCKASDEFRQFDFWIGEWNAQNAQGVVVGSSSIQNILGNCVIFENWSTPVSSGKSFNIYDVNDKKWHQTWVSDKGNLTQFVGELKDGKMIYVAEVMTNGQKSLSRMIFSKLPNGDVRQLGENSTDDGKTWTPSFDFTYVRKK